MDLYSKEEIKKGEERKEDCDCRVPRVLLYTATRYCRSQLKRNASAFSLVFQSEKDSEEGRELHHTSVHSHQRQRL